MPKIFVYGSLKTGLANHGLLKKSVTSRQNAIAFQLHLHDGPDYPFACRGRGVVFGEVYSVSIQELRHLDRLEEHPLEYRRVYVMVRLESDRLQRVWVYLHPRAKRIGKRLISGNW